MNTQLLSIRVHVIQGCRHERVIEIRNRGMDKELQAPSIEYCLLGLLGERPMHGYELHRELSRKTGLGLIWTVKQAQLYAILAKLESEALIRAEVCVQGNRPARRVFHLSAKGEEVFEAWMGAVAARKDFRLDFLAKLYFARQGKSDAARSLLSEQRRLCSSWLAEMRERGASSADRDLDALVYRFRIGQLESMLAWLDECSAYIEARA
jgi:PadR family transcriptional regulator, regulatory protein AphA